MDTVNSWKVSPVQVRNMVSVQVHLLGEGRWRAMTLPVSTQAAHTLARAAKQLGMADTVTTRPAGEAPRIDIRV